MPASAPMAGASATVPLPARAGAASALGGELARLEGTLAGRPLEIQDHHPERTQLPADQATAVLPVLTHDKRVNPGGRVMGRLDRRELRQPPLPHPPRRLTNRVPPPADPAPID